MQLNPKSYVVSFEGSPTCDSDDHKGERGRIVALHDDKNTIALTMEGHHFHDSFPAHFV